MGPRLHSRGMALAALQKFPSAALQWGRGFTAAECRQTRMHDAVPELLQWGRGFTAAEWIQPE